MEHVDPATVGALAEGRLAPARATAVRAHLDVCAECRRRLAERLPIVARLGDSGLTNTPTVRERASAAAGANLPSAPSTATGESGDSARTSTGGPATGADAPPAMSAPPSEPSARPVSAPGPASAAQTAPFADAEPGLPRGTPIGRYIVVEPIGRGGMGVVYAAYDPELDRRVAIKLLLAQADDSASSSEGRQRLLREAQAMARLSHPNVIAVYDVGTFADRVFIALELVEGSSLKSWIRQTRPDWRRIVEVFLAAGRGLQAAHAAGIVHRDFKPDNVLVDRKGGVHVTDFGLARAMGLAQGSVLDSVDPMGPTDPQAVRLPPPTAAEAKGPLPPAPEGSGAGSGRGSGSGSRSASESASASRALDEPLTRAGAVLGTVGYMAPEQYLAERTDARTDQYSFCVALYRCLYGRRPFAGSTIDELRPQVLAGRLPPGPRGSPVPARIHRILEKGLSVAPAARYPTMEMLLSELARDSAARWRRRALVAGGALLTLAAVAGAGRALVVQSQLCKGSERRLTGVWDGPRKQAIETAFRATGRPFARDAWGATAAALDAYTGGWASMRQDACLATRRRGEQSEEVLSLRMVCLDHRLDEVKALTDLMSQADGELVEKAVVASQGLPRLEGCADVGALRAPVRPPDDPAARDEVERLRRLLAEGRALLQAGRYPAGLASVQKVVDAAAQLRYRPLQAEALDLLGALEEKAGQAAAAEKTLYEAVFAAQAGRHDEVLAQAAARLVTVIGYRQAHYELGHHWARHAAAALERMGGNEALQADLDNAEGIVYYGQGRFAEAIELGRKAVALRERVFGPDHMQTGAALNSLAVALKETGRLDEAVAAFQRVIDIEEKALGANHPDVTKPLANIGLILDRQGKHAEAERVERRALAVRAAALGADHPEVSNVVFNLGQVLLNEGRPRDALVQMERALAIRQRAYGPEHPAVGKAHAGVAKALRALDRYDQAAQEYERALAILEKSLGGAHVDVGVVVQDLGDVALHQKRYDRAFALFGRTADIYAKALGADNPSVAFPLTALGEAYLEAGDAQHALATLERADALRQASEPNPRHKAETRFALARALWAAGRGPELARRRAAEARALLIGADGSKEELATVDAWLAAHGGRRR